MSWIWPREFVSYLLRFVPTTTVSADAHDNVAVTRAPAQFTSLEQLQPETVVRYAPDGRVLGRFSDPGNGAGSAATSTYDGSVPRPETLQSRAAERDPATANKVVIVPAVTTLRAITLGPPPAFFFKVLLNGRRYFARVTGGPRSGCVRAAPDEGTQRPLGEAAVRGDTYQGNVPFGTVRCRGTYRLSVSVVGPGNRPYAPFGSATFTVR